MHSNPLSLPVAALMRPSDTLRPDDSLQLAAQRLRETPYPFVPVTSGLRVLGGITEESLGRALANGCAPYETVEAALQEIPLVPVYAPAAQVLRKLVEEGLPAVAVVDDDNNLLGLLSASDLLPQAVRSPRPPMVGGMATPLGVYLTNGAVSGGVSKYAILLTGALMMSVLIVGAYAGYYVALWADAANQARLASLALDVIPILVFLVGLRALPLAGIHAAEHKVVHAIERGEELSPEVVRRMPRVHPRCGTNLAVGITLFLALARAPSVVRFLGDEAALLVAGVITLFCWRPVGNFMQWLITTRPPNEKQIDMGIKAGKELLETYWLRRPAPPTVWQRLWHAGLVHVIVGATLMQLLAWGLIRILNLPQVI